MGHMSAPVVADGVAVVVDIHRHQLVAVAVATGKELWRRNVSGRLQTPPTLYKGTCLFGCADGNVYCLDAQDGTLAWKMRMGPDDRRMVSYGQVQSVWPVIGTVLVADDLAYAIAGTTTGTEGGLIVRAFDPLTGKQKWCTCLQASKDRQYQHTSDLLTMSKGRLIVMGSRLDAATGARMPDLKREYDQAMRTYREQKKQGQEVAEPQKPVIPAMPKVEGMEASIFGHWTQLGTRRARGLRYGGAHGQLLAWDDEMAVSCNTKGDLAARAMASVDPARGATSDAKIHWTAAAPEASQGTAVMVCGNVVVVSGGLYPADGSSKGFVRLLAKADGKELSTVAFDAPVVYGGIAVTDGRLIASLANGSIVCLGARD
jgi:hypothetical protein